MRKWLRCLVCLLVICAFLINLSPLRAKATGAGLAGVIASASSVTVSAPLVFGASLIALGVMANNTNPLVFENVVNTAVDTISSTTDYIKDGCINLIRTVDELGNQAFYVAGEFLESLRQGLFDTGVVVAPAEPLTSFTYTKFNGTSLEATASPGCFWGSGLVGKYVIDLFWYSEPFKLTRGTSSSNVSNNQYGIYCTWSSAEHRYYKNTLNITLGDYSSVSVSSDVEAAKYLIDHAIGSFSSISTSYDLSLGQISTVPIDGTSALDWAPEYQANRLKVIEGGNDPDPDSEPPNDGKWFWPIMLPLTAATLYTMSQADEWSGQTPQEFDDYSTNTEFEILDRPEFDGYKGIELAPITNPNPNPNPGTNPDPDTGGDTDPTAPGEPDPGTDPDPDPDTNPDTDPDTDPDGGDGSDDGSGSWKPPSDHKVFALADLSKFFPFCIPFDLYDFFTLLNADPVAPVLSWEIKDLAGQTYSLDVDLSQWDSVAQLFRRLQLFLFITGLAAASRKFIKW